MESGGFILHKFNRGGKIRITQSSLADRIYMYSNDKKAQLYTISFESLNKMLITVELLLVINLRSRR